MIARYVWEGAVCEIESAEARPSDLIMSLTYSGIRSVRRSIPFSSGLYRLIVTISLASLGRQSYLRQAGLLMLRKILTLRSSLLFPES